MASKLKKLTQVRQGVRMNASKEVTKAKEYCAKDVLTETTHAEVTLGKLKDYRERLEQLNSEVLELIEDEADCETEAQTAADFDEQLLNALQYLIKRIQIAEKGKVPISSMAPTHFSANSDHKTNSVKLPKLQMSSFAGDPLQWHTFWDSFRASIHLNPDLSPVEKFNYLKGLLTDDAWRIADGYRLTDANYDTVVHTLQERFGEPERVIFAHFESLLSLSVSSHDLSSLQTTFDECEKHIRSLVALGLAESTFGQVFTPIIISKLPKYVRLELHRKNGSKTWNLANLRSLLKEEIRAREMSQEHFGVGPSESSVPTVSNRQRSKYRQGTNQGHDKHGPRVDFRQPTAASALLNGSNGQCVFCKGKHQSDLCRKFADSDSRRKKIRGRCFGCFRTDHMLNACRSASVCSHCSKGSHHPSLCPVKYPNHSAPRFQPGVGPGDTKPQGTSTTQLVSDSKGTGLRVSTPSFIPTVNNCLNHGERSYLQTAAATIYSTTTRKKLSIRLLFDTGSSRSFVTTAVVKQLGLPSVGEQTVSLAGFLDKTRKVVTYQMTELDVIGTDGFSIPVVANVVPQISCPVQIVPIDFEAQPYLRNVELAEPEIGQSKQVSVDVLIGSDYYYDFIGSDQIRCSNGLVLVSSKLGFVTSGRIKGSSSGETPLHLSTLFLSSPSTETSPSFSIEKFWKLEDIGVKDHYDKNDDDAALESFNQKVRFLGDRYEVGWPWKDEAPDLPSNYLLAFGRLKSLIRRLKGTNLLSEYAAIIDKQLETGMVETVNPSDPPTGVAHYIPHHGVLQPGSKTTKLRVVYDASAKASRSAPSLNECLHRGPVILSDLCGLLLRFRLHAVAIISDIEKAFLQVSIRLEERDVTRFLWIKDLSQPVSERNLVTFRFCRVPFGVISSPFLLSATIRYHLRRINSPTSLNLASNIYVDNVITGQNAASDASKFYSEAKKDMKSAGMNLREWATNDPSFFRSIPEQDRNSDPKVKVLGMTWLPGPDVLLCPLSLQKMSVRLTTKRQMLQTLAGTYDPCGLISPLTITGKMLMQELWKKKYQWDEQLPEDIQTQWAQFFDALSGAENLTIPRWVGFDGSRSVELHVFCDASAKGFGAAVYIRIPEIPELSPSLLMAKARVCPIKELKIPRLELMAAVIGTRLIRFVETEIQCRILSRTAWSDSMCVLEWLQHNKLHSSFVDNRLWEIKSFPNLTWRHVPSQDNPADLLSRGVEFEQLASSSLWWSGPQFLSQPQDMWPDRKQVETTDMEADEPEHPPNVIMHVEVSRKVNPAILLFNFSSLSRLLRVSAFVFRFLHNCRSQLESRKTGYLSAEELSHCLQFWIKYRQSTHFGDLGKDNLRSITRQLQIFIDSNGIIRCGGRILYAQLSYDEKYPVLLPKNDHFTDLVILDCHIRVGHLGVQATLSQVRYQYWIPQGRSAVKRVLSKCLVCRKVAGGPYRVPPSPDLPDFRVQPSQPFSSTGLDYMGPLFVRSSDGAQKVWICLFTCATTRAIHLEVIDDLSSAQFLLALRRFVALFGKPSALISDNGTQFQAAFRTLSVIFSDIFRSDEVQGYSSNEGISWKFITAFAPWMGGFYERLIGIVKSVLKRILGRRVLSLVELQTISAEVSAMVNSRPLTWVSDEVGDVPLAPSDFLGKHGKRPTIPCSQQLLDPPDSSANSLVVLFKRQETLLNHIWKRWSTDYLLGLREHFRLSTQRGACQSSPTESSVVLVHDPKKPRGQWLMGRISRLIPSFDGNIRAAVVKLSRGSSITRPIKLLYPVECPEMPEPAHAVEPDTPMQSEQQAGQPKLSPSPVQPSQTSGGNAASDDQILAPVRPDFGNRLSTVAADMCPQVGGQSNLAPNLSSSKQRSQSQQLKSSKFGGLQISAPNKSRSVRKAAAVARSKIGEIFRSEEDEQCAM